MSLPRPAALPSSPLGREPGPSLRSFTSPLTLVSSGPLFVPPGGAERSEVRKGKERRETRHTASRRWEGRYTGRNQGNAKRIPMKSHIKSSPFPLPCGFSLSFAIIISGYCRSLVTRTERSEGRG